MLLLHRTKKPELKTVRHFTGKTMKVDYKKLANEIAKKITRHTSHGFKRVTLDKWIDEDGKLSRSLVNHSFNVFVEGKVDDESEESVAHQLLVVRIEFALTSAKDYYLQVLGDCEEVIQSILGLDYSEVKKSNYNPDMDLSVEGDKVRVVFTLNYIIRNQ